MNKRFVAIGAVAGLVFSALWLMTAIVAQDQIVLRRGEYREIEAKYVDRYRCESGAMMFVERHSRLDVKVMIRCL